MPERIKERELIMSGSLIDLYTKTIKKPEVEKPEACEKCGGQQFRVRPIGYMDVELICIKCGHKNILEM